MGSALKGFDRGSEASSSLVVAYMRPQCRQVAAGMVIERIELMTTTNLEQIVSMLNPREREYYEMLVLDRYLNRPSTQKRWWRVVGEMLDMHNRVRPVSQLVFAVDKDEAKILGRKQICATYEGQLFITQVYYVG